MLHAYEMEQAHGVIVDADGDGVPDLIQQEQKSGTGGGLHALLAPCYSVDGGLAAFRFCDPMSSGKQPQHPPHSSSSSSNNSSKRGGNSAGAECAALCCRVRSLCASCPRAAGASWTAPCPVHKWHRPYTRSGDGATGVGCAGGAGGQPRRSRTTQDKEHSDTCGR